MKLGVILEQGGSYATMKDAGQEVRLRYYLRRYAEAFEEVLFFSYGREEVDLSDLPNVRLVPRRFPVDGAFYSLAMPLATRKEMASCDMLRVLQMSAALPATLAKKLFGAGYVVTFGYDLPTLEKDRGTIAFLLAELYVRLASRYADAILYGTSFLHSRLESYSPRVPLIKRPNGVDLEVFHAMPLRVEPQGRWRILSIARLAPEKNQKALIEALAGMDDVEMHFAGSGPERENLERRALELNVPLVLHGTVPQSALPELLAAADLFVLPSFTEGHPKALIEAMASARPCIGAEEVPGIRALIDHEVNGLLTEAKAPAIRASIRRLLEDRSLASRFGAAAREKIARDYSLERILDDDIRTLLEIAEGRRRN